MLKKIIFYIIQYIQLKIDSGFSTKLSKLGVKSILDKIYTNIMFSIASVLEKKKKKS